MRTDLAIERCRDLTGGQREGIEVRENAGVGWLLTRITVKTASAARRLGKPVGEYLTFETPAFPDVSSLCGEKTAVLARELRRLLPETGPILVVGLGNLRVTPDALGPKCAERVLATAHLPQGVRQKLPRLRNVAVLSPGVSGQTGLEAQVIVQGVVGAFRPAAVIAVDALASGSVSRLGNNVQVSSAGIEPGAGVGNCRAPLSRESLGVPVIAVGVPTVVDAETLANDVNHAPRRERVPGPYASMMVTPRDIDAVIDAAAAFAALSINLSLQPGLTAEELLGVT